MYSCGPSHRWAKVGQPAWTDLQQLFADTGRPPGSDGW